MKALRGLGFGFYQNGFTNRLVREANLTEDEAFTVYMNEWSWWSYRVSMIPYLEDLPPIDRAELTRQIQLVYSSGLGKVFFEDFAKSFAHPDAIQFIERTIAMAT